MGSAPAWHEGRPSQGHPLLHQLKLPPRVTLASPLELLQSQARWRVLVACVIAVVFAVLQQRAWLSGTMPDLGVVLAAYLASVVSAALVLPRMRRGPADGRIGPAAYVTTIADIAAMVALTGIVSPRGSHDWVLVVGFFVVHLAEYSFGRGVSMLAAACTLLGYALLARLSVASPAGIAEPAIAAAAFIAVVATFLRQFASRRRRLRRVITLFEHAEQGDLTESYDVAADCRPDVVTVLGGAYNRVRARFENLILTDALTGCVNRRGFEQALERELARAERASSEVALLAIDIDNFKDVNDTYGHVAGDETLEQLGRLLLMSVRTGDIVARVGGDEFVILCPDTGMDGARRLADALRAFVADHVFDGHGATVQMTISSGVAAIEATAADHTASELKLRADRALYDAKHAGRNRVSCWDLAS